MILTVNKSQYLVMYLNHKDFLRTKIMINLKILSRRIPTKEEGIFYKQIINENAKEVDKSVYC